MKMVLKSIQPNELVVGKDYLLFGEKGDVVIADWTGNSWACWDNYFKLGYDLLEDYPVSVFEVPCKERLSEDIGMDEYQSRAKETAIYPNIGSNPVYPVLGLCGESGEIAEKMKKAIRDEGGVISESRRTEMIKELGDVAWYLAMIASELGVTLGEVAKANVEKLASRKQRDVLKGSGDNR